MTLTCEHVQERAAELVRADVPEELSEHLATCPECQHLAGGAESLRADLDAWRSPIPPVNLIDDTLARLAMAAAQPADAQPEPQPADPQPADPQPADPQPADPQPAATETAPALRVHAGGGGRQRRRTSVEILTDPLDPLEPGVAPTRRRLLFRLCAQAAAAVVLFGVCTSFVAVFYPAVTYALEERRVKGCQEQLSRLAKAAAQYHAEHPEAEALRGGALRRALVTGGYADELDFVCPGHNGKLLGSRSYVGELPAGSQPLTEKQVIYIDQFANHSTGFNVAYANGQVETMTPERLTNWRTERDRTDDED